MATAIFKNGRNKCHRSQVIIYLKFESPETYNGIPKLLLCMPYLLRYGDIEFGSHFDKWPSPRYAQFLKCPPSRILKPYVCITQINSQTSIPPKCLRAYRAGPGLLVSRYLYAVPVTNKFARSSTGICIYLYILLVILFSYISYVL